MDCHSGLKAASSCANHGGGAGATLKPAFSLLESAGKGNPHCFSSWDGFWTPPPDWAAPGGCHPGGEGLWYLVPSPSYPHLWRVVNLVGLLCALLWLTTWLTHAGKQKSMLPLCVEVRGGSSMILWNNGVRLPRSVKRSRLTEDGEMQGGDDQVLISRVSNTLPRPLQPPPGNIHMEIKVLLNGLWNSYSEMLQMAQGSLSCVVLNCCWWGKKCYWGKTACVEVNPFTFTQNTTLASSHYCFLGTQGIFQQWLHTRGWAFHGTVSLA